MGIHNCMQTHSIIKAGFDVSGSVWGSPVKITDADGQRFHTAFEIRSYRGGKDTELIFVCRFHSNNRIAAEHIGADV